MECLHHVQQASSAHAALLTFFMQFDFWVRFGAGLWCMCRTSAHILLTAWRYMSTVFSLSVIWGQLCYFYYRWVHSCFLQIWTVKAQSCCCSTPSSLCFLVWVCLFVRVHVCVCVSLCVCVCGGGGGNSSSRFFGWPSNNSIQSHQVQNTFDIQFLTLLSDLCVFLPNCDDLISSPQIWPLSPHKSLPSVTSETEFRPEELKTKTLSPSMRLNFSYKTFP